MESNTTVVVVTYNRRGLLENCIRRLLQQTLQPERIVIIDNASSDGTGEWLHESGLLDSGQIIYFRLEENSGGAGGFAEGIRRSLDLSPDWIWMMDDDADPDPDALSALCSVERDSNNIYGSVTVNGDRLAWPIPLHDGHHQAIYEVSDIPKLTQATMHPFLGFMVHRNLVRKIGLPDAGYFIAADDVEYCTRAKTEVGSRIYVVGDSRVNHPAAQLYQVNLFGVRVNCLRLVPWKRYYDTRNRLFIARKYYGAKLYFKTIPGSFVRLFAALVKEPNRWAQLWAFTAGMVDGLLLRKGRRHTNWRISQ